MGGKFECDRHGFSSGAAISKGVQAVILSGKLPPRKESGFVMKFFLDEDFWFHDVYAFLSELEAAGIPRKVRYAFDENDKTAGMARFLSNTEYICHNCLDEFKAAMHEYGCLHIRMRIEPSGIFCISIDEFPNFALCAEDGDIALRFTADALQTMSEAGADLPVPYYNDWYEYVYPRLCSMGKLRFGDLPAGQRMLRKGYPTMWDKQSEGEGYALDSHHTRSTIPADEIVWHHVFGMEMTEEERELRRIWTSNPNLHF